VVSVRGVEEEVEQAASTPLLDQEEKSVTTGATETREAGSPSPVAEEETPAEKADDTSAVVPPVEVEADKEEDSSDEEESVELVSGGPEEAAIFEEEAVPHNPIFSAYMEPDGSKHNLAGKWALVIFQFCKISRPDFI
jgi:hypothetical protein